MSRAASRSKAVEDALRKVDHAINRRGLDLEAVESCRHRKIGDPQVEDSGNLARGERSDDWIREQQDRIEERYEKEVVAAFAEIEDTLDAVTLDAENDLRKADEARRARRDYKAEEARRPEIRSRLSGSEAMLGESKVARVAKLAEEYERRGDVNALNALRSDPEVHEAVFDPHLSGPTATLAGTLRGAFRAADREERAEVEAVEAEITSYREGEVARTVAAAKQRVRDVAGSVPEAAPEPEGAEA